VAIYLLFICGVACNAVIGHGYAIYKEFICKVYVIPDARAMLLPWILMMTAIVWSPFYRQIVSRLVRKYSTRGMYDAVNDHPPL
jgi:hypothetical protein